MMASNLDERDHDADHAGNSQDQIYTTHASTDSQVIWISREKLRSLIQEDVKSAVETAQLEEMRSMSRHQIKETLGDVFNTEYCASTDEIKDSSFSFMESVESETVHCGVLDETLSRSFNRWS